MAVYVDDYAAPYHGMLMHHMMADSTEELFRMADLIGLDRRHVQYRDHWKEHFDVCLSKRKAAIRAGAIEVGSRQLVRQMRERHASGS